MNKVLAGFAALALVGAAVPVASAQVLTTGTKMPAISATELYNNEEYKIDLTDLQGYVVVVEFWATWCGPCKASIPHLNELQEQYKDKGVVFIGLSDEDPATVKPFVQGNKNMRYVVGSGSQAKNAFGVNGIPHAFLVDPTGVIRWQGNPHPQAQGSQMDNEIDKVLAKTPPTRSLGGGPEHNARVLDTAEKALANGDMKTALANIRGIDLKALPKGDGHQMRYNAIVDKVSPAAQADFDRATADLAAKRYVDALAGFQAVAKTYRGLPIAAKAGAEVKKLEGSTEVGKAQRAETLARMAANSLDRAKKQAAGGDDVGAYRKLQTIVEKYPDTAAAKEAATLIAAYEADAAFMTKLKDNGG